MNLDPLTLEKTIKTPYVNFNAQSGIFELKGKSVPENPLVFYKPIFDWVNRYLENPNKESNFFIQLDYYNTSSSKVIVELIKKFETIYVQGKSEVVIHWCFQEYDEAIQETGEDLKSFLKVPFILELLKD